MAFLLRASFRAPRAYLFSPAIYTAPRRFASTDYGSVQSGQEQGINQDNPKKHLEHPGPEPPSVAKKGQTQSSSSSPTSSTSSSSSSGSEGGAQPKIHQPSSPAENDNPDVKKHNEEMKNRHEVSANQLSEDDNKVDKQFWKGDVGDINSKDKSS